MNAIVTANLSKQYGKLIAVNNLNLTIKEGELFSLLGLNGAGKTTTIKMLCGLIKPTKGDAFLLGDSIKEHPQIIKAKINISPQETAVATNLSVKENLELIAGIYGQNRKDAKENAKKLSFQFSLESVFKKKAKFLSGGMQRRLSIAMALISNPKILFLDEPSLGLDVLARRELWKSIETLKGKITIVLTSHYLEEVEALSDRIGIMANGRLIEVGTLHDLEKKTGTKNLEEVFVALAGDH
jgi:ABC-2 type transport system ATP-binding protein